MGKSGKSRSAKSPSTKADRSGLSAFEAGLYERNWAYLPPEAQARLRQTVIFAAGVGIASSILTLAYHTGFRRFILADDDRVELSNLNRQEFTLRQLGKNKAKTTARRLRRIRPDVEVSVLPYRLDETNYQEPLGRSDIIINSIDFEDPTLFRLNDDAQAAGKPVLQLLTLGWGGVVLAFLPDSPSLASFIGVAPAKRDQTFARLLATLAASIPGGPPPYLLDLYSRFLADHARWPSIPQVGVGSAATAALAVRACVALALGEPIKAVPEIMFLDTWQALAPQHERDRAAANVSPPGQQERGG